MEHTHLEQKSIQGTYYALVAAQESSQKAEDDTEVGRQFFVASFEPLSHEKNGPLVVLDWFWEMKNYPIYMGIFEKSI